MEKEKVSVSARVKMRGLRNKGIIEISQDTKNGDYILIMGKGLHRRGIFNFPEAMWRMKCSRDEVASVINDFLSGEILK
jgi:hypothetical protein